MTLLSPSSAKAKVSCARSMKPIMKTKSKIRRKHKRQPSPEAQAKRLDLCHLSKLAKMILKNIEAIPFDDPLRECIKVNDVLRLWHRQKTGQHNLDAWDTFKGWKDRGFSVQKGEAGFLIWGAPRKMKGTTEQPTQTGGIEEIEKEYSAFPLCYLFHTGQVCDEKGNQFNPNCPYQQLALIPSQVRRTPFLLPAPKLERTNQEGGQYELGL